MFNIGLILTTVIIFIVIGVFLYFLKKEFESTTLIASQLTSLKEFIERINGERSFNSNELSLDEQNWLIENIVCEYSEEKFMPVKEANRFLAKGPIASLIPEYVDGKYKSIPALLTSIGITGTFLGITIGLSQFDSTAFDSTSLLASAASLLDGMKTAFYTSLAGLSLSAGFMVALNGTANKIQNAKDALTLVLSESVLEVSPITYLRNLSSSADNQKELITAQLKSVDALNELKSGFADVCNHLTSSEKSLDADVLAEKISESISTGLVTVMSPVIDEFKISSQVMTANTASMTSNFESLTQQFTNMADSLDGDKLSTNISGAVTGVMTEQVTPVLNSISSEIGNLREIKEQSQQELAELLVNKMRDDLITPVTHELQKTAAAVSASNTVTDQLNKNVEAVLVNLSDSITTINTFQKDTMQELQEFAQSLTTILDTFKQDTQGTMTQITAGVKDALDYSVEGMKLQRQAFDESAESAAGAFNNMEKSLTNALDDRQQMESQLFDNVELRLNTILTKSDEAFAKQTLALAQAVQAADEITAGVKKALDHSVEGMRLQRQAFDESAESAAGAFNNMEKSLTNALNDRQQMESQLFENVESRMNVILTKSNEAFTKQTSALSEVGQAAGKLMDDARANLVMGLGDIDNKIQSMSAVVQTELEAFRKQYQANLNDFFEQQNSSLEQTLGKQADKLSSVVEQFKNTFESEYQTRHNLLENLTSQHQNLQSSARTIEKMAKAVGLHEAAKMSELQDTAATVGKQVGHLKKEYAQASIAFKEITEGMPKAMNNYFERANSSFETFFSDFDHSSSTIHNRLAQAADFLIEAKIQEREFDRNGAVKV